MSYYDDFIDIDADYLYMQVENEAKRGVWATKDGTEIRITEMSDSHLRNAIAMLKRNNDEFNLNLPWIEVMEEELERRANDGKIHRC